MVKRKLFEWELDRNYISQGSSGNCNFQYVSGLRNYLGKPAAALVHILTEPFRSKTAYSAIGVSDGTVAPQYKGTAYAMILFAQGSEDPVKLRPYGPQLKEVIEGAGLGVVLDCGPAENLMHSKKPGVLYVWKIDHAAAKKWWQVNVYDAWVKREDEFKATEREEAKELKAKAEKQKAEAKEAQAETKAEVKRAEEALGAAYADGILPRPEPFAPIKRKLRWRCRDFSCNRLNEHEAVKCAWCARPKPAKLRRVPVDPYMEGIKNHA